MGHIYITRHGQTIWNVEGKICGATDIALTDLGREQAKELGERIASDKNIHIDEIIASPLKRASDTAKYISDITGIPMHTDKRITEQNFGKFEGDNRHAEEFAASKRCFADSYGGGESMLKVAQRVYNILDELKENSDKTYLIVAHNGIARIVHSYFYDETNEEFASHSMDNCELIKYEWK